MDVFPATGRKQFLKPPGGTKPRAPIQGLGTELLCLFPGDEHRVCWAPVCLGGTASPTWPLSPRALPLL